MASTNIQMVAMDCKMLLWFVFYSILKFDRTGQKKVSALNMTCKKGGLLGLQKGFLEFHDGSDQRTQVT